MKLYASKHQAALNEGIIQGVDETIYDTLQEAIDWYTSEYPGEDLPFAWTDENGKIRVGWTV